MSTLFDIPGEAHLCIHPNVFVTVTLTLYPFRLIKWHFNFSLEKETPIEKEIRLVREREEEFRRQRSQTNAEVTPPSSPSSPAPNVTKAPANSIMVAAPVQGKKGPVAAAKAVFGGHGEGSASSKDLQYEMATARLKREIEENLRRERELFREGRLKSLPAPEPEVGEHVQGHICSSVAGK